MRALLSIHGSRREVEPTLGPAVWLRALGAGGCAAPLATGVTQAGERR